MRILMLAQFYSPIIGGEERHVRDLSIELAARGHDVSVVTLWHEGLAEVELDQGVQVYRVHGTIQRAKMLFSESGRRHAQPFPDPGVVRALYRILARERLDIVHGHNWLVHSFLPLKRWSGAKLVVTLHRYGLLCPQTRLIYRGAPCSGPSFTKCLDCAAEYYGGVKGVATTLAHRVMSAAERTVVDIFLPVSRAVAEGNNLVESGLPYQVIPNFVPDDIGEPRRNSETYLSQLPKGDYLLFVGDLERDKGVDVLLQAYHGLANAPPLVLIGRPRADMPTEFPHGVTYLKRWPHDAVMGAWRRSLLGLVPSVVADPCPTVAMEAMSVGRPVVATRVGGLIDLVVNGETGLLVPPGDPKALREAIERLLVDSTLRVRMGQAGRRKVVEFKASAIVPRIENVYRNLNNQQDQID